MIKKILKVIKKYPQVQLTYLFGSHATGKTGPLSDVDIAIYVKEKNKQKIFDLQLQILADLQKALQTDHIDLVMLNTTKQPELKYAIIKDGQLIFEREPYRVLVEPQILNEYFDFVQMLKKFNLTAA